MRFAPHRAARVTCAVAIACVLLAACGSAGKPGGAAAPANPVAGGPLAIPTGSTAQTQLTALKGCKPTPQPNGQEYWLVNQGDPSPTFTVPKATPKIGSSLSGWPSAPMVVLGNCSDTESWTFAAADSKNLYLAVQVDSTLPVKQGTNAAPWSGDVVQFAIDGADDKNQGGYDAGDDEMGFLQASDGSAFLYINIQAGKGITPIAIPGGHAVITRKNGITLYEGAIPWAGLGVPVSQTFGFNIAVSAGGAPYQAPQWGYEWTQGLIEAKNPVDFAQLTFKR